MPKEMVILSFTQRLSESDRLRLPDEVFEREVARAIGKKIMQDGLFLRSERYDPATGEVTIRWEIAVQTPFAGAAKELRDDPYFMGYPIPPRQRYPGDAEPPDFRPTEVAPAKPKLSAADRARIFGASNSGALIPATPKDGKK